MVQRSVSSCILQIENSLIDMVTFSTNRPASSKVKKKIKMCFSFASNFRNNVVYMLLIALFKKMKMRFSFASNFRNNVVYVTYYFIK